ncbi:MAG: TonB-dependent receptor plug domain-containing protein [Alphaproteobacteria bacterium]
MLFGKKDTGRNAGKNVSLRDIALAATALTALTGVVQTAHAQQSSSTSSEEVVVTGSRAARAGYVAPSPTTVVRSEVIDRQAATGVGQVLVQNPAFKGTRTPNANANNTSSPGQFTADLRALGGQRTLVLVDGARVVPYAAASNLNSPNTTDLNLLPTMMIDRVEVVTGGASAQYGSDAVAGVVNIFMKKDFDGLRIRAQAGESSEGDYQGQRFGFVAGKNLADNKFHIVASGEYDRNDGVDSYFSRDWGKKKQMLVSNGAAAAIGSNGLNLTNGLPALLVADNVNESLGAGGVILPATTNPAALRNMAFNADGTLHAFNRGLGTSASVMIGGEGDSILKGVGLLPPIKRYSFLTRLGYDFSDNFRGYVQAGYAESQATLFGAQLRRNTDTYRSDNPYLSTTVRTALGAATTFTMSRIYDDMGVVRYDVENKSPRVTVGAEGSFGSSGWDWDGHYSYGRNDYRQDTSNNTVLARYLFAIDAARDANGNIVCAATIPGGPRFNAAAAGCVPLNPFGEGNVSAAAIAYVNQAGYLATKYTQDSAAFNVKGEPFSTWAGKTSVAAGVEYRKEKETVTSSPLAAASAFVTAGNGAGWSGGFRRHRRLYRHDRAAGARRLLRQDSRFQRRLSLRRLQRRRRTEHVESWPRVGTGELAALPRHAIARYSRAGAERIVQPGLSRHQHGQHPRTGVGEHSAKRLARKSKPAAEKRPIRRRSVSY